MGHRGEQLSLVHELLLDLRGHVVERDGEQPDFAAESFGVDAGVELAVANVLRGADRDQQRTSQSPRDAARHHRQTEQRDHDVPPVGIGPPLHTDGDPGGEREREPDEHAAPHARHQPPGLPAPARILRPHPHLALGVQLAKPRVAIAMPTVVPFVTVPVAHVLAPPVCVAAGLARVERDHLAVAELDRARDANARPGGVAFQRRQDVLALGDVARDVVHVEVHGHPRWDDDLDVAHLDVDIDRGQARRHLRVTEVELDVAPHHTHVEVLGHDPRAAAFDRAHGHAQLGGRIGAHGSSLARERT